MGWVKTAPTQPLAPPLKVAVEAVAEAGYVPLVHEPPAEPPTTAFKDEMEWGKYRATKGWVPEAVAGRMHDFIKHKGLFGELLAFSRRRR